MNHNLKVEIFDAHLKSLQNEFAEMVAFKKDDSLTVLQEIRLTRISTLLSSVYARKLAYDTIMRHDMDIIRNMDALGIDMEKPPEEVKQ